MMTSGQDGIAALRRQVGEDPAYQRRVWRMQRVGWLGMVAVVLLALAGAFGDGPISARELQSADGSLRLRHEAVLREDDTTRWHIGLPPGAAELRIATDWPDHIEIQNIEPAPLEQRRGAAAMHLRFAPAEGGSRVSLTLLPSAPGILRAEVSSEGAVIRFRSVVLP